MPQGGETPCFVCATWACMIPRVVWSTATLWSLTWTLLERAVHPFLHCSFLPRVQSWMKCATSFHIFQIYKEILFSLATSGLNCYVWKFGAPLESKNSAHRTQNLSDSCIFPDNSLTTAHWGPSIIFPWNQRMPQKSLHIWAIFQLWASCLDFCYKQIFSYILTTVI